MLFYFERELYFFLTRKTVFSKKTALSCIFFRISIDNLGPYMCYTKIFLSEILFPFILFIKRDLSFPEATFPIICELF